METEKASVEELRHGAREESSLENIPAKVFLWEKIPNEIILQFFDCHDLKDQIFLSQTCKQLNNLFKEVKKEYRKKFIRHFPFPYSMAAEEDAITVECWYKEFHLAERYLYGRLDIASWRLFSLTKEGRTELLNERLSNQLKNLERKLKEEALESKRELTEEQLEKQLTRNLSDTFSSEDRQEYTILYWARQADIMDSRNNMLHCFYDFLKKRFKGKDLVYWAIQCCQPLDAIQKLLFAAGSSPVLSPYKLLEWAVEAGNEEFLEYLFKENPRLGEECISAIELEEDSLHGSILHIAVVFCPFSTSFPIIDKLLAIAPALLNQVSFESLSPLCLALSRTRIDLAEYFLGQPDIDVLSDVDTPLHRIIRMSSSFKEEKIFYLMDLLLSKNRRALNKKGNNYIDGGCTPLVQAIYVGQEQIVRYLLQQDDIEVVDCDNGGNTSLHAAVTSNCGQPNLAIIQALLEKEPGLLHLKDRQGAAPLFLAIASGHEEGAMYLLEHERADLLSENNEGDTLLHAALQPAQPNLATIALLLQKIPALLYKKNKRDVTPLMLAITMGREKAVEYLLEQHPEDDEAFLPDNEGNTLLHVWVSNKERRWDEKKSHDIMQALLHKKPELLNQRNKKDETPLLLAISLDDDKMVEYLLRQEGIDVYNKDGDTALHTALERSNFWIQDGKVNNRIIIETLLKKHPHLLYQKNGEGLTPLFLAIERGLSLEVTHCLIQNYEDRRLKFDDLDEYQETLLHAAVRKQPFSLRYQKPDLTIIHLLLRKAPHLLYQKNKYGFTPIFLAIQLNSVEIVEFFLSSETVSEYHFDNNRNNPLHAAVSHWGLYRPNSFIIELLLRNKLELLYQKNADGMTPLMLAIEGGQEKIVQFFLREAQDEKVFASDDAGNNPLHAAFLYTNEPNTRIIHKIIKKNPKLLNQKNAIGMSPASLALSTKSREVTEYFSAQPHANVNEMASEIEATIEFLYKKACTVRVREKTGIEILPSLECSFVTKEDAQVVFDGLNTHFRSSAETKQPILEIRENGPSTLLLSIETCHDMLQQAKEDMVKRYEELNLLLHTLHPDLKKQVEACMRKHLGVDFNIQLKNRVHSIKKIKEFHEEVQRLSLPSGLKIALTAFVMTLAVYGAFAIATSIIVAIPIAAVAIVPIGYFVRGFFNSSKYKNDKAAIKKIFEKPAMGSFSKQENCGKEREEKKEDDPPRQVM